MKKISIIFLVFNISILYPMEHSILQQLKAEIAPQAYADLHVIINKALHEYGWMEGLKKLYSYEQQHTANTVTKIKSKILHDLITHKNALLLINETKKKVKKEYDSNPKKKYHLQKYLQQYDNLCERQKRNIFILEVALMHYNVNVFLWCTTLSFIGKNQDN